MLIATVEPLYRELTDRAVEGIGRILSQPLPLGRGQVGVCIPYESEALSEATA